MEIKLYSMCLIKNGNKILMLKRQHDDFKGYIPPGGKIEFNESPLEGTIREVKEETGVDIRNLRYKGMVEFCEKSGGLRYMIFHYITEEFSGELLKTSEEGVPEWVEIEKLSEYEMQEDIKKRINLLLEEGSFELHWEWDKNDKNLNNIRIYRY